MQKRLPAITPMQFLVLGLLKAQEQPGRVVREALAAYGVKRSAPAFYQLMARLERDRLIDGWYEQVMVGDQAVTERRYRLRPAGARVWTQARDFYSAIGEAADSRAARLKSGWSDA
jgi:DNA-binding PadR family transcriptional regulator